MKRFTARLLALCGLVVLASASLAPFVGSAQSCPTIKFDCNGQFRTCTGTLVGDRCEYARSCIVCGAKAPVVPFNPE